MRLGEITANNAYEDDKLKTSASLRGIQLISTLYHDSEPSTLKIIDDIEVEADVVQAATARPAGNADYPDTQASFRAYVPSYVALLIRVLCSGQRQGLRYQTIPNSSAVRDGHRALAIYSEDTEWSTRGRSTG